MRNSLNNIKISKFLSLILRHKPQQFNLKLDKNGYCPLDDVLRVLKEKFGGLDKNFVMELVKNDPKGRFEILEDLIRACYGHSIEVLPIAKPGIPPEILYHGTNREGATEILKEGLKPMDRQFVHLSLTEDDAYKVGLRRTSKPVILKILAKKAYENNIDFFQESNVFLVKYIPSKFIAT